MGGCCHSKYISYRQFQKNHSKKGRTPFHLLQNDCGNKFNSTRNTNDNLSGNNALIHLCGKSRTNRIFFLSSQHNTLHYSISWEFPDPRCPKQGIFPAFIVQTLVLLSSNIQMCWLVLLASLSMLPIGCPWFTRSGTFVDS